MPDIGAKIVVEAQDSASPQLKQVAAATKEVETAAHGAAAGGEHLGQGLKHGAEEGAPGAEKLKEALNELAGKVPGLSGSISALGQVTEAMATGPLAVAALGVGTLVSAFELAEKAVEAFEEKQERVTRLDAALAQQGLLTDEYREKLQKVADEYGEATGQGTIWLDVLAKLTQFGADSSNIEEYAKAVENLSGLMGGNTERAAQIFGRAINGNVGMLHRFGIEIDKSKSGAEQLEDIMSQLATRGGGQLAAQTETLAGQFNTLRLDTEELFAAIGNLINNSGLLGAIIDGVARSTELLKEAFPGLIAPVDNLTNKTPPLRDALGHLKTVIGDTGDAAEEAGDQLDDSADGAKKAADAYKEAADAAKKLREQQDSLADAKTSLKLAQVDAAEASGKITEEEASKEKADIRATGAREKIEREIKEQDALIKLQEDRAEKAHTIAENDRKNATQAQVDLITAQQKSGRQDAEQLASDPKFLDAISAQKKREQEELESAKENEPTEEPRARAKAEEEIKSIQDRINAHSEEIDLITDLREKYKSYQQAKSTAADSAAADKKTQEETSGTITDSRGKLEVLGIQQQAEGLKAGTEQAKLAAEAKKEDAEKAEKDAEKAEKDAEKAAKDAEDAAKKVIDADADRPGFALRAANSAGNLKGGAPGSDSAKAAAALHQAADRVRAEQGGNDADNKALAQALNKFLETLAGANLPTRSEFQEVTRQLDRLSSQFQKGR